MKSRHVATLGHCVVEGLERRTLMAAGDLDPTFGAAGVVTASVFAPGSTGRVVDALAMPDGRWLVLGVPVASPPEEGFTLARLNPDGSPDPTFGTAGDGRVSHRLGTSSHWTELALQADGKVVVGGTVGHPSVSNAINLAVARCNPDGTLDATFAGTGWRTADFVLSHAGAGGLVAMPDGNIVVGGGFASHFVLARFRPDGSLDPAFAGDGVTSFPTGRVDAVVNDLAPHPDGGVVAVGTSLMLGEFMAGHVRADGTIEGGGVASRFFNFATGVVAPQPPPSLIHDVMSANAAAAFADGSYLVVGDFKRPTGSGAAAAVRIGTDGRNHPAFVRAMPHLTFSDTGPLSAEALYPFPDGRFVTAGRSGEGSTVTVVRHNASGIADTTFGGGDGRVVIPVAQGAVPLTVAVAGDKLVVAVSLPTAGGAERLLLARLDNTPAPADLAPPRLESVRLPTGSRLQEEHRIEFTFTDDVAVSVSTPDADRIVVSGPRDFMRVPFPMPPSTPDGTRVTIPYSLHGRALRWLPDGSARLDTRGTYLVQLDEGAVFDTSGNPLPPTRVSVRLGSSTREGRAGRIVHGTPGTGEVELFPTFERMPPARLSRDGRTLRVTLGVRNQTSVVVERERLLEVYALPSADTASPGAGSLLEQTTIRLRVLPGRTQRFRVQLRIPETTTTPGDYYLHFRLFGTLSVDGLRSGSAVLPQPARIGGG